MIFQSGRWKNKNEKQNKNDRSYQRWTAIALCKMFVWILFSYINMVNEELKICKKVERWHHIIPLSPWLCSTNLGGGRWRSGNCGNVPPPDNCGARRKRRPCGRRSWWITGRGCRTGYTGIPPQTPLSSLITVQCNKTERCNQWKNKWTDGEFLHYKETNVRRMDILQRNKRGKEIWNKKEKLNE